MKSKAVKSKAHKRPNIRDVFEGVEHVTATGGEESEFRFLFRHNDKTYCLTFKNWPEGQLLCMGEAVCSIEIPDHVIRSFVRFVRREWAHIL